LYWLREDMHDSKREEDNIIATQKTQWQTFIPLNFMIKIMSIGN